MAFSPKPHRKSVSLAVSLCFLLFLFPLEAVTLLVGTTLLLFWLTREPAEQDRTRGIVYGLVLCAVVLGTLSGFFHQEASDHPAFTRQAHFLVYFMVLYVKRACWVGYECWALGRSLGLADTLRYFLGLPFLICKSAVFSPSHYSEGHGMGGALCRRGVRTICLALLHLGAYVGFSLVSVRLVVNAGLIDELDRLSWGTVFFAVLANYLALYLFRYGWEQLSVGAARVLGHTVDDNYQNPLAARDYAEFWRRWNVHFRDLVMRLFYFPSVLYLQRRFPGRRALVVVMACSFTFLGHGMFMLWVRGAWLGFSDAPMWVELVEALCIYEVIETVFVSAALLTRNPERRKRWGRWGLWAGIGATYLVRSLAVLFFLRRGVHLGDVADLFFTLIGVNHGG